MIAWFDDEPTRPGHPAPSQDFSDTPTAVDIAAPDKAREAYALQRRIEFHRACWEMDEFLAGLRARATNFSDDFSDEPMTKEIER